jgi:hypothetical protein
VLSFNGHDGNSYAIDVDEANWSFHPDDNVDVAIVKLNIDDNRWLTFACEMFADNEDSALFSKFGPGDLVYIVGLYRLFPGAAKISPVVHTGHVAMTPDEEIPIKDTTTGQVVSTRGYLIEAQTLEGLSGSPVFVRYTNATGVHYDRIMAYTERVYLVGLWQGAWDAIAGNILTEEIGQGRRVPVGMGITVPARRIMETLKIPELEQQRSDWIEQYRNKGAATMDCG